MGPGASRHCPPGHPGGHRGGPAHHDGQLIPLKRAAPGPQRDPTTLHRVLLRKNLRLRRLALALDGDDDVVLLARLPTAQLSAEEIEATLAELLTVGDEAFEGLVHLAYPGVFPPLRRPTNP